MIAIIDYGVGNSGSISNMLMRLGIECAITSDPRLIASADKLILPGVGSFDSAMRNLAATGIVPELNHAVIEQRKPILGICLGMQMMTRSSAEGTLHGLSWINADVVKFEDRIRESLRIPHMGWNTVRLVKPDALWFQMPQPSKFYFVHSYYVRCACPDDILTATRYGSEFTSAFARDNIYGVQFHPEKSHKFGLALLNNFASQI